MELPQVIARPRIHGFFAVTVAFLRPQKGDRHGSTKGGAATSTPTSTGRLFAFTLEQSMTTTSENQVHVEQSEYEAEMEMAKLLDQRNEIEGYPEPSAFDLKCSNTDLANWFEAAMVSEAMARLQSLGLEDQHERLRRVIGALQNDQPIERIVSAVVSHRDPKAVALSVRRSASDYLDQLIQQAAKPA